jgi:hypothetical protein
VTEVEARGGKVVARKIAFWFVLLIVGFLTGFILQYSRLQQARQQLSASTNQLDSRGGIQIGSQAARVGRMFGSAVS